MGDNNKLILNNLFPPNPGESQELGSIKLFVYYIWAPNLLRLTEEMR